MLGFVYKNFMIINQKKDKQKNIIIGINIGHDGGVAVVVDGIIKCVISEEKLNRQRYSSG